MDLPRFAETHLPALGTDEIRFNVQIAVLAAVLKETPAGFAYWTLGAPGHCAIQYPERAILLGDLNKAECQRLAEITALHCPAVVGADDTARWFAEHAVAMGARFEAPIPQRIHVLKNPPRYPGALGSWRELDAGDTTLLFEWISAFRDEAVPHDPAPARAHAEKAAISGRYLFWTVDDHPVSMAAISRRLRHSAAIAPVYTLPGQRGKGFAGSITAAVVERIFAEGKTAACLYTDLRNPMSNRCYANIGFTPHCDSWHYVRAT